MKRCVKCGTQVQDFAVVCPQCGSPLAAGQRDMGGMRQPAPAPVRPYPPQTPYYRTVSRYDHTGEFDYAETKSHKAAALLPYFLGIPGLIISSIHQKSEYVQFHVRQQMRYTILSSMLNVIFLVLIGLITFFGGFGMPSYYSAEGLWLLAHMVYGLEQTGTACSVFSTFLILLQLTVFVFRMISAVSTMAGKSKEAILVRYFL